MRVALSLLRIPKSLTLRITLALTFVVASHLLPPIAFTQNQSRLRRVAATTPTQAVLSASQSSTIKASQEIDDEEVLFVAVWTFSKEEAAPDNLPMPLLLAK